MKKHLLLATTIIATGLFLPHEGMAEDNTAAILPATITAGTAMTADRPMTDEIIQDPRVAAQRFVEHVNYARVALAMKNGELAQKHVSQAENMVAILKTHAVDERRISDLESGRVVYNDGTTASRYHYFPIETGPMKLETVDTGPFWAKSDDLSVTDADVVYVTLDLSGDTADKYLADAATNISQKQFNDADKNLSDLTDSVVKTEDKMSLPVEKARDNIALAHDFILMRNYDGARYALSHADDALDAMAKDDRYKANKLQITSMRDEVKTMQDNVQKKDPTMFDKASVTTAKWWNDLGKWVDQKTQ